MKFSFHPDAENEFNHAINFYEGCKKGLGYMIELIETNLSKPQLRNQQYEYRDVPADIEEQVVNY